MESKVLHESNLLKTTEAAIVANVDVHHVNKLIDEGILPGELFVLNHARRVLLGGCVAINFYVNTADILDASARRYAIRSLMPRLRDLWAFDIDGNSPEDWSVHRKFVTIDFGDVVADTRTRLDVLERAREAVTSDPEILGGTLVLKGTRVPVYDVAAMLLSGIPHEEIIEDYPSLDKPKLELAAIYAKANPQRGRPSERMKVPAGSKLEAYKTFPRRKAG
ncbi:DUF433 domain-containing protein [Agrobacterium rhizogenes]|nr:DUF433 domain-containing protein [Rhizobium rhizogenes]NTI98188.1 DUF433 domain-containing protein [Rhizobium rhizogenes]NTJ60611.1 DUF433 domain-containing protein [Rhizobium rhizogenes]OCJ27297.1 hypothetical protein A6U89_29420 [Agrobacterium sp. B133/95]